MITLLEALIEGADGAYANAQDLRNLEHVMSSWTKRKEAYLEVQTKEKLIIDRAVKSVQDSNFSQNHSMNNLTIDRCRRDMTLTLRAYALAMLLQDEEMLKDRFLYWQQNILQAMNLSQYKGVKLVFESACIELQKEQADLLQPYFQMGYDMIMSNQRVAN
jgi:Phycobilisome protein